MKTINEFLNIKCGKQINEFINNKNIINNSNKIMFPEFKGEFGDTMEFTGWRTIDLPRGKYFIFNDLYYDKLHIGNKDDIESRCGYTYSDFEDFDAKDIIAGFNTLKEAVIYVLKETHKITDKQIDEFSKLSANDCEEQLEEYYDDINNIVVDRYDFMAEVLTGEVTDDMYNKTNIRRAEETGSVIGDAILDSTYITNQEDMKL